MTGSIGSPFSRLRQTGSLGLTHLVNSFMADHMMKVSVVVLAAVRTQSSCDLRYEAANFSIGITTATATIPARKARAMSRRGSGWTLSSRRQNQSHARAGSTPPAKAAIIGSSSLIALLYWPFGDHQEVALFFGELLPDGFGDERHEGVEEFQRDNEYLVEGGGGGAGRRAGPAPASPPFNIDFDSSSISAAKRSQT